MTRKKTIGGIVKIGIGLLIGSSKSRRMNAQRRKGSQLSTKVLEASQKAVGEEQMEAL